eukprot:6752869-Prymnesium_polylepis.1
MMQTCTHTAARGHVSACPDGTPCLPACLLVSRNVIHTPHGTVSTHLLLTGRPPPPHHDYTKRALMMLLLLQASSALHRLPTGWGQAISARMSKPHSERPPPLTYEQHMELKERLLHYMQESAYVKLAPATIAGVGVFTLRDIPAAIDPFAAPNAQLRRPEPFVLLTVAELARMPQSVYEHALSFFPAADADASGQTQRTDAQGNFMYELPANGFAAFDASWYVNHAEEANVAFNPADPGESGFLTLRAVSEGEELMDYRRGFPDLYARTVAPKSTRSSSPRMCATTKAPRGCDESSINGGLARQAAGLLAAVLVALAACPTTASAGEYYLPRLLYPG